MLTVNVQIGTSESVFPALYVVAARRSMRSENYVHVECFDAQYKPIAVVGDNLIKYGTVFVMNDNGKTVATYYLTLPEESGGGS